MSPKTRFVVVALAFGLLPVAHASPPAGHAAASASESAFASAPRVVSGKSIGPIVLGMSRMEVQKLGLPVLPHPSGQFADDVRMVGPYYVVFRNDRVGLVKIELTESRTGVRIGSKHVAPSAKASEIALALPGCGKEESGQGGSRIPCDNQTTEIGTGLHNSVSIGVMATDSSVVKRSARTCIQELGEKAAAELVAQCADVSPGTHPPCNGSNSCALIRDEIVRGCKGLTGATSRPSFCDISFPKTR